MQATQAMIICVSNLGRVRASIVFVCVHVCVCVRACVRVRVCVLFLQYIVANMLTIRETKKN